MAVKQIGAPSPSQLITVVEPSTSGGNGYLCTGCFLVRVTQVFAERDQFQLVTELCQPATRAIT